MHAGIKHFFTKPLAFYYAEKLKLEMNRKCFWEKLLQRTNQIPLMKVF